MIRKDFILRMIEMLAEMIAGILGLIKKGKYEEADEQLEHAYDTILKDDALAIRTLEKDKLLATLVNDFNYSLDQIEMVSELMYVDGELFSAKGEVEKGSECFNKSLILLKYIMDNSNTFSFKRQGRAALLHQKLNG